MVQDYQVHSLHASDVTRAFALVQHLFSNVELSDWHAATATAALRNNWLSVVDPAGTVRGLCYVFVSEPVAGERQLEVPVFASISLFDEKHVARRLLDCGRQRAREMSCTRIHFWSVARKDRSILIAPSRMTVPEGGLTYDLLSSQPPSRG